MIQTPPTTPYRGPTPPPHQRGDAPWVKALVFGPAVVGSFCALVLMNHAPAVTGGVRRLLARTKRTTAADPSLALLRAKFLGRSKHVVMTAFGPPPAATAGRRPTWYYPVSETDKLAMAVSFVDDRAATVEFLAPGT